MTSAVTAVNDEYLFNEEKNGLLFLSFSHMFVYKMMNYLHVFHIKVGQNELEIVNVFLCIQFLKRKLSYIIWNQSI